MTILFARIAGLNVLTEQIDLGEARDVTNACLEYLYEPIQRYGGTLDKFFRQMIMGLFGAPESHENDVERALHTALEMVEAMQRFNASERHRLSAPLGLCCGINTGLVFAGEIGATGQEAYSVVGDPVNLANRLAYLAEPGQILVAEDTHRAAPTSLTFHPLPSIRVRGKLEPVKIYFLIGEQSTQQRKDFPDLLAPLVGRTREMSQLKMRLQHLRHGQGGLVSLNGGAGVGKSRLVAELRSSEHDLHWLEGRCVSYGTTWPFAPFRDLLRNWFGGDDQPEEALRQNVWEALTHIAPEEALRISPFLLQLLGIPLDPHTAEILAPLSADGLRARTIVALRTFFHNLAIDRPTVVVLEDFHWVDQSSIDILHHLLPLTQDVPLLFMTVARPGYASNVNWAEVVEGATSFNLLPLSQQATVALVTSLLGGDIVPAARKAYVLERIEGNPLFVQEVIRTLIEEQVLVRKNGHWELTPDIHTVEIPNSLRGLLTSRIDRLDPAVRDTLSQAAVIGRTFTYRMLADVVQHNDLDDHLRVLRESGLIRYYAFEGEEGRAYIFDHVLTQEAAYEKMLIGSRIAAHRHVLSVAERLYQDNMGDHWRTLAHHAYAGEVWEKAAVYMHAAGDRAKTTRALPEAVFYYHRAMDAIHTGNLSVDRKRLTDLYHECATAHTLLGNYETARAVYKTLLAIGEQRNDAYIRGHALHSAAVVETHLGDLPASIRYAQQSIQALEEADADWCRGVVLLTLAQAEIRSAALASGRKHIEEGLRLVGDTRRWPGYDPRGEGAYYAGLGALLEGDFEDALAALARAEVLAERAGESLFVGLSRCCTGLTHAFNGNYSMALEALEAGTAIGEDTNLPLVISIGVAEAAWAEALRGNYGAALRRTEHVYDQNHAELREGQAIALLARGDAYAGLHMPEHALDVYQQVIAVAGLSHVASVSSMRGLGVAYMALGQPDQAMASFNNAVNFARFGGLKWFRAQALRDFARATLSIAGPSAALPHIEELLDLAQSGAYRPLIGWGYLLRGRATGNADDLYHAMNVGQALDCLALMMEAGQALAKDPQARAVAAFAARDIADGLSPEMRTAFLARDDMRRLLT